MTFPACYLCRYRRYSGNKKSNGEALRSLYKFPNNAVTRALWFNVCGLSENVDDVTNLKICASHFSTNDFEDQPITAVSGSSYFRLKAAAVPSVSVQNPHPESIESTHRDPFSFTSIKVEEITISDPAKDSLIKLEETESNKRRFFEPRFVREIEIGDVAIPKRAHRVINLVKMTDSKKSKKIKSLQDQNRYLRRRIASLEKLVKHLQSN